MKFNRLCSTRRPILSRALAGMVCAATATIAFAGDVTHFSASSSSLLLDLRGTVRASPESVAFAGPVQIHARTVIDRDPGAVPTVELSIDLSAVAGVGVSSGNKYATQSHEVISVPFPADGNGEIAIDFPYETSGAKGFSAYGVGHASFKLFFVGPTGSLSIGRGWIDTPAAVAAGSK